MGVSMSVYVGVVVKLRLDPVAYKETVNTCANTDCSFNRSTTLNFCGDCGTKISLVEFDRTGTRDWNSFVEATDYKYEDRLVSPEYLQGEDGIQLLLDNSFRDYLDENGGFVSIQQQTITEATFDFATEHNEMLNEMREFFGKNLSYEYGAAAYWS